MAFLLLFLQLGGFLINSMNLWCQDSKCTSCLEGYLFGGKACLAICPSFYIISGKTCISFSNSKTLFKFSQGVPLEFDAKSINTFHHPDGLEFRSSDRRGPIMTKDRGIYFANTSSLVSNTSWILAPVFRISLMIRVLNSGVIFQVKNENETILQIIEKDSFFVLQVLLYNNGLNITKSYFKSNDKNWCYIDLYWYQILDYLHLTKFGILEYLKDFEFRSQIKDLNYSFGSVLKNSFTGFIYNGYFSNNVEFLEILSFPDNYCGFNEYYYDSRCIVCNPNCSDWPWCTRDDCNLCFSKECRNCSSYQSVNCTECVSREPPYCELNYKCLNGAYFNCSMCEQDLIVIKGVCSPLPYEYNEESLEVPVINERFVEFKQFYGIFQSGNNSSTYGPYNQSESDDPIPMKSRGLYFPDKKKNYLKSINAIIISPEFTIGFWIYTLVAGEAITKVSSMYAKISFIVLVLKTQNNSISVASSNSGSIIFSWVYFMISVKIENYSTSIYTKISTKDFGPSTFPDYHFVDQNSLLIIGNYENLIFSGYIYSFTLWQTYINNNYLLIEPCEAQYSVSCLHSTYTNQYYDNVYKRYNYCHFSCINGCSIFGSCNMCSNSRCSMCSSFELNATCFKIDENYCYKDLQKRDDGQCCHPNCMTCYNHHSFTCYTCTKNKVLLGNACYENCPIGFTNDTNICILQQELLLDLTLNKISSNMMDNTSFINFQVANSSLFYPKFSIYNPIPAKNRGYYFGKNSSIISNPIVFSYNLTISFWIKHLQTGTIFRKMNLDVSSNVITFKGTGIYKINKEIENDWKILIFTFETSFFGNFSQRIDNHQFIQYHYLRLATYMYNDTLSSMYIGDSQTSFIGFIYRIKITNGIFKEVSFSESLSNCSILETNFNNSCIPCKESCLNGCISDKNCSLCIDPLCETCTTFSSKSCEKCKNSSYLKDGSCICNSKTYWNQTTEQCEQCSELCLTCSEYSNCLECVNNSFLLSSKCFCEEGYFLNPSPSIECSPCHAECRTCDGNSKENCLSCKEQSKLSNFQTCSCIDGWFFNFSSKSCGKCHPKCKTCRNETDCLSCALNSNLLKNQCFCNTGYFWSESLLSCVKCESLCLDCLSNNDCIQCKNNSELIQGFCNCKDGFYSDKVFDECLPCNEKCLTCDGNSESDCLTCDLSIMHLVGKSCFCNDGFYFDDEMKKCRYCSLICKTCFGLSTTCTSCSSEFFLMENSCYCKGSFYFNGSGCEPCHQTCKLCNGPSEVNCQSCWAKASITENSSCQCESKYFMKNGSCFSCHSSCLTCNDESRDNCTSCIEGLKFQNNECKCKDLYYWDDSTSFCIKCSEFCLMCNAFNDSGCEFCNFDCFFCQDNSVYSNETCTCIDGFYNKEGVCLACNETCKSCSDKFFYSCTSCQDKVLIGGMCFQSCALGYINKKGICQLNGPFGEVMKLLFNYFSLRYIDKVSNFELGIASIENMTFPIQSYDRGIYFNGFSSGAQITNPNQESLLLSDQFLLSFWINPFNETGTLIEILKTDAFFLEFSLKLIDSKLNLQIFIQGEIQEIHSNFSVVLNEWSLLGISLSHNSPSSASFLFNFLQETFSNISEEPFMAASKSLTFVGFENAQEKLLKGFIYRIDLRRNPFSLEGLILNNCLGNPVCLPDVKFLKTCGIYQFFSETSLKCEKCLEECRSGCRHRSTCGMCFDENCLECLNFESGSCVLCKNDFQLVDGTCETCQKTEYFNSTSKICGKCEGLCVTCLEDQCLTCKDRAEVINGTCACSLGYFLNGSSCSRKTFTCSIKISLNNSVQIVFSEALDQGLKKEDIEVLINDQICNFEVSFVTKSIFLVECKENNQNFGSFMKIYFKSELISTKKSLLLTKNLTIALFSKEKIEVYRQIEQAKVVATTGRAVGASLSLCLSIASFDASTLFNFLNFAEIYSVVVLYELDIDEALKEFLRNIRIQSSLTNIFEKLHDRNLEIELNEEFVKFGYRSTSLLVNSGVNILILIISISCFLIVKTAFPFVLQKLPKLIIIWNHFHYSAFIRYWIQTNLDLLITSIYSLFNGYFRSLFYFIDYCFAAIVIIIEIVLYIMSIRLILLRPRLNAVDSEKLEKKFATLFSEFQLNGTQLVLFYPLFIARRFFICFLIYFVPVPVLRLIFSFTFSVLVIFRQTLFYLLSKNCFKQKIDNFLHIVNEGFTVLFHIFVIISLSLKNESRNSINDVCITLVTLSWILNIMCSCIKTIILIIEKVKRYKQNKNVVAVQNDTTVQAGKVEIFDLELENTPKIN